MSSSIKNAAHSLEVTKWQTIKSHIFPIARPGGLTGIILSVSRASGKIARLIVVGTVTYIRFVLESVTDSYTALPIQIYNWVGKPKVEFHELATAGIIVLPAVLVVTNMNAI